MSLFALPPSFGREGKNKSVPFRSGTDFLALLLQNFNEAVETGPLNLCQQGATDGDHHADPGDIDVEQLPRVVTAI